MMSPEKLTIIVSGMIAADPYQGGAAWAVLQYVLGLRELGHRVLLAEPVDSSRLLPAGIPLENSTNAACFRRIVSDFDLRDQAVLLLSGTRTTCGISYERLESFAREADLVLNVSGMLTDERLLASIPVRVYLDLDPAFNQLWNAQGIDMRFSHHTHFFTVGQAVGTASCSIPTCGVEWKHTYPPVVLSHWAPGSQVDFNALTTVGNWRGYGSIEFEGKHFGQKAHSLRRFFQLPQLTSEQFLLAMAIHAGETSDIESLNKFGWKLVDPLQTTATPMDYQRFVKGSKGEFGIAKSGYVESRCGWFSDRSACYLASGRPVIAQDTGFGRFLPVGEGLFSFDTAEDVLAAIDALNSNYQKHSAVARSISEEYFCSKTVLTNILSNVG
jgi:hypothetical protein